MSKRKFCYVCGGGVEQKSENSWYCEHCGQTFYQNIAATAEIALFNPAGEILLAKRAHDPWKGKYDLPGGFVEPGEDGQQAMLRELYEELGLTRDDISEPKFVTTWTCEYPWGIEVYNALAITYTAKMLSDQKITPKDDVAEVKFVNLNDLNPDMFSVPVIGDIIQKANSVNIS